ncbi:MAG: endopeptidase La [Porphyromonas sp.]|nr:endopeptidase La [Porphyromonas sp.]
MSSKNKDAAQLFEHIMGHDVSLFPILPFVESDELFELEQPEPIDELPLLPLRNVVLFPGQVVPVSVASERSQRLVRWIEQSGGYFGAITQSVNETDRPTLKELYPVGVVAQIEGISESIDGKLGITIRGLQRFRLRAITSYEPFMTAAIELMPEQTLKLDPESRALMATLKENFLEIYRLLGRPLPESYISRLQSIEHLGFIINFVLTATSVSIEQRQMLLGIDELKARGIKVLAYQQAELQMLRLKLNLAERAKNEIERHNKEFFLQQQIRTIQEELGTGDEELDELHKQAQTKGWPLAVRKVFDKELRKAERFPPHAPEYGIQIQYLRTILSLPWGEYTQDNFDLKRAERRLNADHYGLEKVKERILEHLAVLKLKKDLKAPIICLYGPPGVGKTSLGKSIAESLGRKYVRISLGGVHDESEIRGHRRTYIGAMCGRIIQGIQRAGSCNPVFVLDEIDKLSDSYKGDPASALLEVLDPEQNTTFHDNYLDIDFDLSKVLFIATANNISALSQPLRDRMELIEVTGYTAEEKHQIAKNYLIPKAIEEHGLTKYKPKLTPLAIDTVVEEYTRESGVRMLSKRIAEIMRKQAWQIGLSKPLPKSISPALVREYLGKPSFQRDRYQGNDMPGVVVGLAWTSVGGDILYIESSLHKGTDGKLILTGSLGDVMKESAVLALSYIRTYAEELGISEEALKDKSVHIHVPEGAVPKDGPSAGITITTSLVSAITQRRVRAGIAMTGEITLRGKVLPVGGIKEKILAAKRSGITDIILCKENLRDIQEIKADYLRGLNFHYVETIREVLDIALIDDK